MKRDLIFTILTFLGGFALGSEVAIGGHTNQRCKETGIAVRFEQVASGQDVTIHERRYDGKVWARGAMPGREVWMDFPRVPAEWRGRVLLHEFIHNAGFSHADGCDVMADPPQWCDGRPIVRSEYISGLQRLARCQQERPSSIQATSGTAGIVTDYAPTEVE